MGVLIELSWRVAPEISGRADRRSGELAVQGSVGVLIELSWRVALEISGRADRPSGGRGVQGSVGVLTEFSEAYHYCERASSGWMR